MAGTVVAVVVVVALVVPVAPPTVGAGAAGAVDVCTSIIEERSAAPLEVVEPAAGSVEAVLAGRSVAGAACTTAIGLESGAGAGELNCA